MVGRFYARGAVGSLEVKLQRQDGRITYMADERGIVLPAPQLAATEDGKPYFTNVPVHMSLSHCKGMAACLLAARPCGVDCEARRPLRERVAARCFAEEERAALAVSDDADMLFTRLWTLKESYMKALGLGFSLPMRAFAFSFADGIRLSHAADARPWHFLSFREGSYFCALCAEDADCGVLQIRADLSLL